MQIKDETLRKISIKKRLKEPIFISKCGGNTSPGTDIFTNTFAEHENFCEIDSVS
jgi:hypothetical protein